MEQTKTIVAGLVVLGVAFVGFAWWVWVVSVGVHGSVPVFATLLTMAVALGAVLLPRARAQRAAAALEHDLRAGGPRGEGEPRSAELDRMRREFEQAVQALKASRLGGSRKSARDALSVLPWYAIIGPPACGKTTALRRSGLRFPHLKGTGQRPNLKGLGGTRNLDWFLTNEAILIDTAGRWSVERDGADRQEWEAFLKLLRKHRPRKPLNGVILAVSLAETMQEGEVATVDESPSILGLSEDDVRTLAERMRERLEELAAELGVRLPVYVLLTKCDLIQGFAQTFSSMDERERRQIWGFNSRVGEASSDPRGYFETCFRELCDQLERRALARVAEESQPEVIERIFGFPAQMRALEPKLAVYLEALLQDSSFRDAPMLRGVYFTCGTQEGAPAQAISDELAQALGIEETLSVGEERDESYFLHDMLREVVFKDSDLATASDAALLRKKRARRAWMTATTLLATAVLAFSGVSFALNQALIAHTESVLREREEASSADDLRSLYDDVLAYERGRPSVLASVLYPGGRIGEPLRALFARELQRRILRDLYGDNTARLKEALHALASSCAQGRSAEVCMRARKALTDALELHLLLGRRDAPQTADCPVPAPLAERERLVAQLLALWSKREAAASPEGAARRVAMLEKYLTLLSPEHDVLRADLAFRLEQDAVSRARAVLGTDDAIERALAVLLERSGHAPMLAAQIADPALFVSRQASVPGGFVRDAWRRLEGDLSDGRVWDTAATAGCWVLGGARGTPEERREALEAGLRERYLARYAEAWRGFIDGLSARPPTSLAEAESLLVLLPPQLDALFQRVREQTTTPPMPASAATAAREAAGRLLASAGAQVGGVARASGLAEAGKRAVEGPASAPGLVELAAFTRFGIPDEVGRPTPLDGYRKQLVPVLTALAASRADPMRLADVKTAAEAALTAVRMELGGYATFRAPLERLLVPPLEATLALAAGGSDQLAQDALQQAYCQEVYAPYREHLSERFPFKQDHGLGVRAEDIAEGGGASLDALTALLKPSQGALWTFVEKSLAGYVVGDGSGFRFGSRDGRGGGSVLRGELLAFLERARRLREALFAGKGQAPRFRFEVTLRGGAGVAKSLLFLGGQEVARYDNAGYTSVRLEWPGSDPQAGVELQLELDDRARVTPVRIGSPWGLLLLVDGSGCREPESTSCRRSGRCDPHCIGYGPNAGKAQQVCAGLVCYLGLHTTARARVRDHTIALTIPAGRPGLSVSLDVRDVGETHPLTDPTLFDLRVPSRIALRARAGCADD